MIELMLNKYSVGLTVFEKPILFKKQPLIVVSKEKCNECTLDNLTLNLKNLLFRNNSKSLILFEQWLNDNVVSYTIDNVHYFNFLKIEVSNNVPYSVKIYTINKTDIVNRVVNMSCLFFWNEHRDISFTSSVGFMLPDNLHSVAISRVESSKEYPYVNVETVYGIYKAHIKQLLNARQIIHKISQNGINSTSSMVFINNIISEIINKNGAINVNFQMSLTEPKTCILIFLYENNVIQHYKKNIDKVKTIDGNTIQWHINQSCFMLWNKRYYKSYFMAFDDKRPNTCIIRVNSHLTWTSFLNVYFKLPKGMQVHDVIGGYKETMLNDEIVIE